MHVVSFNSKNLAGIWAGTVPENESGDSGGRGATTIPGKMMRENIVVTRQSMLSMCLRRRRSVANHSPY